MCGFAVFAMQVFRLGFDWNVNSVSLYDQVDQPD